MELNREQILKSLECCASEEYICTQCPIDEKIKDDCECGKVVARNALALIKELTEENERLHEHLAIEQSYKERLQGILLEFTDIVHKWGNKHGYDTSEISLVPILNEATAIKSQIKSDTVQEMQKRLNKHFCHDPAFLGVEQRLIMDVIDQTAKEMEEDRK